MAPKKKRTKKSASKEELSVEVTQKRGPKDGTTLERKKKTKKADGGTKDEPVVDAEVQKTQRFKRKKKTAGAKEKTVEATETEMKTEAKTEFLTPETVKPGSDQSGTPVTKSKAHSINDSPADDKCLGTIGGKLLSADDEIELQRQLTNNPWFHGLMPRDEIEDLLKVDGQFLVRKTDVAGKPRYAVSVMNGGRIRHILLNFHSGIWWLKDLKKNNLTSLISEHVETKTPVQTDGTLLVKAVPRPDYCILHDHVEIGKKLGGGAFGDVHIGKLKKNDKEFIDVAVKKMKSAVKKKQRAEFVKEAKLMRRFSHANIVHVVGVAAQEEPILILLELASGGALKSKLHDHPEMPKEKLFSYATDACRGMCYLASRNVIHRDIAARNCLLGSKDEVKISDFGLSVADKSVLKLEKLNKMPIRWLAPEVLRKGEFSTKSDVWAYGVLVWEIFEHCKSDPFPGESNMEARKKILSGEPPMKPPDGAPEMIKNVMSLCFTQDPAERPVFEAVFKLLAPKESPP